MRNDNRIRRRQSRQRGALLGIVMVFLAIILAVSTVAVWNLRSDTSSAGRTHLEHQLFDCAEQGLAYGKQYFSTTARQQWNQYLSSGQALTSAVVMNGRTFTYSVSLINNPENPPSPNADNDSQVLVVSRCSDDVSKESRAVEALVTSPLPITLDYQAQTGHGFRNQNNFD